jgi:hypothetical protein
MDLMLRALLPLTILFISSSCSLFKAHPSLKNEPVEKLLNSVKVLGEGKGRLGFKQQSYVFNFDAVMKDSLDWLLAVEIPLHGEEVMILKDIKAEKDTASSVESFEARINDRIDPNLKNKVLPELRSMIRFILAAKLGLPRFCTKTFESEFNCVVGKENFLVSLSDKSIRIKISSSGSLNLDLVAENLTDSFFSKTHFTFRSVTAPVSAPAPMTLELFWK